MAKHIKFHITLAAFLITILIPMQGFGLDHATGLLIESESTFQPQDQDSTEPFLVEATSSLRFFKDMDNFSSVIAYISEKEVIEVFEEIDEYYSATYEGEKGYILKSKVKPLNFADREEGSQVPGQKKDRWTYLLGKYDEKTAQALFEHKIWKGMSTNQALDSWGYPRRMDRYLGDNTRYEEWFYTNHTLIFAGNQLVQWQRQ